LPRELQLESVDMRASQSFLCLQSSRTRIEESRALLALTRRGADGVGRTNSLARAQARISAGVQRMRRVPPIETRAEIILADAFEILRDSVRADACALACWELPLDEFLARLRGLRGWDVSTAAVYLGALRNALRSGDFWCPWLEDDAPARS
jgi:hypothetical protein